MQVNYVYYLMEFNNWLEGFCFYVRIVDIKNDNCTHLKLIKTSS